MENLSMCRICLATDVRLCSIASHLRDMYERITAVTFKGEDSRPLVACYICRARLQNCNRLRTSCLRSEELITEMKNSGVIKPQAALSTNAFKVVSVLNFSVGHVLQNSTECHVKEEASEIIHNAELDHQYTKDVEDIKLEIEDPILEENHPNGAGPSSKLAHNMCPKIVKVVLERIDLNDTRKGTRVSRNSKITALKDSKDPSTNNRKIEVIGNEQTETITIIELKRVTKKIEVEKPVIISKIIESCDQVDLNLHKCDNNVLTSVVNDVGELKSTNDTYLEQSVSSISSKKNKPFSCELCNKCFSYKHVLKNHILTHTGEKPYKCYVCNKCFSYKQVLKRHILTHTGEKPYQCNVCNKCFGYKHHLKVHICTHTGDKPYQCYVCNKCFSYKQGLKIHILTHTSDKPYKCIVCKICFNRKSNLKAHIRIHTGEKPYQCNICKKCFVQKGNFQTHVFTQHTNDKPYQCNVCKKCFNRKDVLKTHIHTHIGGKSYK